MKSIPVSKGYVDPVICTLPYVGDYFEVGVERFLDEGKALRRAKRLKVDVVVKHGSIVLFDVCGEFFTDRDDAEKKRKILMRKHRDAVRDVAKMFGVHRASQAENVDSVRWLIENYSVDDLLSLNFLFAFNRDDEAFLYEYFSEQTFDKPFDPVGSGLPVEYFFENDPFKKILKYVDAYGALVFNRSSLHVNAFNYDGWSWLKKQKLDACGVPAHLVASSVERCEWVENNFALKNKLDFLPDLVKYRVGELLYLRAVHGQLLMRMVVLSVFLQFMMCC